MEFILLHPVLQDHAANGRLTALALEVVRNSRSPRTRRALLRGLPAIILNKIFYHSDRAPQPIFQGAFTRYFLRDASWAERIRNAIYDPALLVSTILAIEREAHQAAVA